MVLLQPVGPRTGKLVTEELSPTTGFPSHLPVLLVTLGLVAVAVGVAVRRRSTKHAVLAGVVLVLGVTAVIAMPAPQPATRPVDPVSEAKEAEVLARWRACNTIQIDPKTAKWITITHSTMVLPGEIQCEVVAEAQMNIDDLRVHVTLYDKDDVKLGADELHFQNLGKGEKQKVSFWVRDGTTKIVSK